MHGSCRMSWKTLTTSVLRMLARRPAHSIRRQPFSKLLHRIKEGMIMSPRINYKSRSVGSLLSLSVGVLLSTFTVTPAVAQQTTGTPCSPDATTTVDGRYLPNQPAPFGGEINLSADQSKPCWRPIVVPPKGAPNVLLIMTDDQGYGISGTFGGVIPTPTMDRIAQMG